MATSKRKNTQNTKTTACSGGTGCNNKRQCTRSITSTISVKQEPEEEGKKKENDNDNTTSPNSHTNDDTLPTRVELSKKLCRIVDTDIYSREEGLETLKTVFDWLRQLDLDFLKSFHVLGGVIRVLDFLTATMEDVHCAGNNRSECIGWAGGVITNATFLEDDHGNTEDIVTKIVASIVDYDGINTLISAIEEFTDLGGALKLAGLENVLGALRNVIANGSEISKEHRIAVFETCIDVMPHLKSIDATLSNVGLGHIFVTLSNLVRQGSVTTDYFRHSLTIVSKCLDVFKKNDGTWIDRGETVTDWAIVFFIRCYPKRLRVNDDSDYETLLHFYTFALKQHAANTHVRGNVIRFFRKSCTAVHDKNIIKQSGVMESLALFLGSNEIDDDKKKEVGVLIGKIAALV